MQATRGTAVAGGADPPIPRTAARIAVAVTAAVVLVADIVSKAIVVARLHPGQPVRVLGTVLQLDLTRNPGAAFSIGTGSTIIFSFVAIVVAVVIIRTARQLTSVGWGVSLGLLLGGALGNLSDRIFRAPAVFRGHVVDWIELPHWPVFNLADSAITIGAVLAVVLSLAGVHLIPPTAASDDPAGPA